MPADLEAPLLSVSGRHSLSPSGSGSSRQVPGISTPASSQRAHGRRAIERHHAACRIAKAHSALHLAAQPKPAMRALWCRWSIEPGHLAAEH